jgi:hypothetical protein
LWYCCSPSGWSDKPLGSFKSHKGRIPGERRDQLPPLPFTRSPDLPARPALPYRSELDILQVCLPGTLQDFRFRFFAVWPSAEQYTPKKE